MTNLEKIISVIKENYATINPIKAVLLVEPKEGVSVGDIAIMLTQTVTVFGKDMFILWEHVRNTNYFITRSSLTKQVKFRAMERIKQRNGSRFSFLICEPYYLFDD